MTQINPNQINLGNESAIDLLISQNKAKKELANNLQGLGVEANADSDSLEQLAYKVSTVNSDSARQKIKNLVINTRNRNGDYWNINNFIVKNGWIFSRAGTSLKYKKLSAMKTKVTTYDNDTPTNLSMSSKSVTNRDSYNYENEQSIFFNTDGSYLFVLTNNTILRYAVSGYDGDTLTIDSSPTILVPKFNNESIYIKYIDINDSGTKILICDDNGKPWNL